MAQDLSNGILLSSLAPKIVSVEDYSDQLIAQRLRVFFTNGYAASIVKLYSSIGDFEVAVIDKNGELDYTTDVTGEAVRCADADDVNEVVRQISELPAK